MQERLIIRLPASTRTGPVPWFILAPDTEELIASGQLEQVADLAQLSQQAQRCVVTVAVPGQDAIIEQVTLPGGARRHLNKVVPFALEEDVAVDIEQLHFAWPPAHRSLTPLPVVVVAKKQMQAWQLLLEQAQISADEWVPDYLLLPFAENEWHCLQLGTDIIVRSDRWSGFTLEQRLLEQVPQLLPANESLTRIVHYGELNWAQPPAPLHSADIEVPLTALALGKDGFDLRQQAFKPKRKRNRQRIAWQPLATAAGCFFIMLLALNLTQAFSLNQQAQAMQAQALSLYQQQFPDERRVVNLRVQLQRKLDALGLWFRTKPSGIT